MTCFIAIVFVVVGGGMRALGGRRGLDATTVARPVMCRRPRVVRVRRPFLGRYDHLTNAMISPASTTPTRTLR
jgi:hypothetical protein